MTDGRRRRSNSDESRERVSEAAGRGALKLYSRGSSLARSLPFSFNALSLTHLCSVGSHLCISSASSTLLMLAPGPPPIDPLAGKVVMSFGGHSRGLWSILSTLRWLMCASQVGRRLTRFLAMEKTCSNDENVSRAGKLEKIES
jgi:hypothetical protein